jgi:hypothetical protein
VHWLERCRRPTRGPLAAGLSAAVTSPAPPPARSASVRLNPRPLLLYCQPSICAFVDLRSRTRLPQLVAVLLRSTATVRCNARPRPENFGIWSSSTPGRPSCSRPSAMPGWPSCSWPRSTLGRPQLLQAQSGPEASQGFGSDPLDPIHRFDSLGLGSTSTPAFVMPTPPPTDFDTVAVTSATTSVAPSDLATTIATI